MDLLTCIRAQWDRVIGFGLVALGFILLLGGWAGASSSLRSADEISYLISGGLGGLFALGLGATLLISADLHDEWRKLDRIEEAIRSTGAAAADTQERAQAPATPEVILADGGSARSGLVEASPPEDLVAVSTSGALVRGADVSMLALGVLALGLLAAGWVTAASPRGADPSMGGAYLAATGVLLLAVASAGFAIACKARCRDRRLRLLAPWAARLEAATGTVVPGTVLVADELPFFHRPGCPTLAGLATRSVDRADVPDGLSGCGICGAE